MSKAITNDTLTPLPKIFIRGKRMAVDKETQRLWDDLLGGVVPREGAKEFTRAYMTPGTCEHKEFETATTEKDRETLVALVLLQRAQAMESPAAKDLAHAAELLLHWRPPEWAIHPSQKGASFWHRELLTEGIKRARLVMARTKKGTVPAILCPDHRTAAFVSAAFRGVEVCPGCRQLFAANPEREQMFCSEACGQRIYQRNYRQRKKQKKRRTR